MANNTANKRGTILPREKAVITRRSKRSGSHQSVPGKTQAGKTPHGNRSNATILTERGENSTSIVAKQQLTSDSSDENRGEHAETCNTTKQNKDEREEKKTGIRMSQTSPNLSQHAERMAQRPPQRTNKAKEPRKFEEAIVSTKREHVGGEGERNKNAPLHNEFIEKCNRLK